MTKPQIRNPMMNIAAPKTPRHPSFDRCIAMPVLVMEISAKPSIIPAAIWNGNKGPIMEKHYPNMEAL